MIARILINASVGTVLFLGSLHRAYTLSTDKFGRREKQLETTMKQVSRHISGETTLWKVWIGIHISHSMGLVLFGLIYGYLALSRWELLLRSHFLIGLGLLWLVGFILLALIYWFRGPLDYTEAGCQELSGLFFVELNQPTSNEDGRLFAA